MRDRVKNHLAPGELRVLRRLAKPSPEQAGGLPQDSTDGGEGLFEDAGERSFDPRALLDVVLATKATLGPDDPEEAHTRVRMVRLLLREEEVRRVTEDEITPAPIRELAPERLDLGGSVEPEDAAEVDGTALLERLRTLDAQERHQQQREDAGAQAIEGRTDAPGRSGQSPQG